MEVFKGLGQIVYHDYSVGTFVTLFVTIMLLLSIEIIYTSKKMPHRSTAQVFLARSLIFFMLGVVVPLIIVSHVSVYLYYRVFLSFVFVLFYSSLYVYAGWIFHHYWCGILREKECS